MKAAIFNPYWDTLGGGERYCIGAIKAFKKKGYSVYLEWKDEGILNKLEKRFGTKLPDAKVVPSIERGDGYDACFWVSDGSVPNLKSRRNILHFQVPFKGVGGTSLINRMKFYRIKHVVCNSEFTKNIIDREYGVNSLIIYPPVSVADFKPKRKKNIVAYVGRFSELAQNKGQDTLIKVFKKFYKKNKDWQMILAGGVEVGDNYSDKLFEMAEGYPVKILKSPEYRIVKEILGEAKMFWSASGYGVNEEREPKGLEHFGITVVEAMAAKAIPIVVAKGGHKEIVEHKINGFLWKKKSSLLAFAQQVADNFMLSRDIANKAHASALKFSEDSFIDKFTDLLN